MTQGDSRLGWRLVAACTLLVGLAVVQSPGFLVADTKLDLAVAPVDFLARAAHLWDAEGAFGQLQNQAYGYLWPMGPFFAMGAVLDIPGWVVQRLWLALVLCTAMVGATRLSRALGVRSDLACLAAGFAFALSPRMLTVLGPSSIEVWPSAVAPWVLLPLVVGSRRGSAVGGAALSALAIAMVGGVNAAATAAVLPLGALWVLTRPPGARRRALMLWWPVLTLLGTAWWIVPLFLLGQYSPPFLDFIETASVTTYPTTLSDALRGTSSWVPFVDQDARAGRDLITSTYLPLNSAVLLAAGMSGLALRRNGHRTFLVLGVLAGLALVTMGHHGAVQGWLAPELRSLLDGALAPLRNVHKFDVVLRLPLVIGLAFTLDELHHRWATGPRERGRRLAGSDRTNSAMVMGVIVLALIGSTSPAWATRITPSGSFEDVPGYWRDAAAWLESEQDDHPGVALLVPGSSFGTYIWGTPRDEPMQALAGSPWAVRNAIPLTPAGNIRMLDEVERRLNEGRGSAGLASYLRRAGVSHVVLRNDLERGPDIADPVLVHQALDDTPGLARVATFGPDIGGDARIEGDLGKALVNSGWQAEYPAIEVYRFGDDVAYATTAPDASTVVVGGPEDLLDLADAGVVEAAPVQLAVDRDESDPPPEHVVVTDGLRGVERSFGRLHDAESPTLLAEDWATLSRGGAVDYSLDPSDRWLTLARLEGASSVTASSTQSDPDALGSTQRGQLPAAAVDGDPRTSWRSAAFGADRQWWRIDLVQPRALEEVSIRAGNAGEEVLEVSARDWTSEPLRFDPGERRSIIVPGETDFLTITDVSGRRGNQLELAEVDIGSEVVRRLVLPETPEGWGSPDAVVIRRLGDSRRGCASVEDEVRCAAHKAFSEEESRDVHRRFTSRTTIGMPARLSVLPVAGELLNAIILRGQPVSVSTSSAGVDDPRAGAVAAIDGDPTTTWIAAAGELNPELRVSWLGTETVTGLGVSLGREVAARLPERVELSWPGGTREVELRRGSARFPPIRTSQMTIKVVDAEPATDLDFDGNARNVAIGIGELVLAGVPYLPLNLSEDPVRTRCGVGPTIRNNGTAHPTRVLGTRSAMLAGERLEAILCRADTVPVRSGVNDVDVLASDAFVLERLVLGDIDVVEGVRRLESERSSPASVRADIPGAGIVGTRENSNPGWRASIDGRETPALVLDGWRQGWTVPEPGALRMEFEPDRVYRLALLGGGMAVTCLGLITIFVLRRRRWEEVPAAQRRRAVPAAVPVVAMIASAGLIAGHLGAVAALLGMGGALGLHRRAPVVGAWWIGAPLAASYVAYALRPWGGASRWAGEMTWPHLLVVVSVAGLVGWVVLDGRLHRRPRWSAGRSTSR